MGDCGSSPKIRANCFDGILLISFPSSVIFPDIGFISLDSVLISVDFPQAFAPIITLILLLGITRLTPWMTVLLS